MREVFHCCLELEELCLVSTRPRHVLQIVMKVSHKVSTGEDAVNSSHYELILFLIDIIEISSRP